MKKLFVLAALACAATISLCAQQPQSQAAPISALNAKYANGVAPGYAPTLGAGLVLNLGGGTANCAGTIATYAGGALTMTAAATNYVYLDTSASCAPAVKTATFAAADIPVAVVVAGASAITSISDVRTPFVKPGSNCPTATSSTQGCSQPDNTSVTISNGVLSATVSGQLQMQLPDPLGTQSVLVPASTVATFDDSDPTHCAVSADTTSGSMDITITGNTVCSALPGATITWSAPALPSYVTPANVTSVYVVANAGFSVFSQIVNIKCSVNGGAAATLMDGGQTGTDTGVLKPYSLLLSGATGANIGTISCVATMAANSGGNSVPFIFNIPDIQFRAYYSGTAPPATSYLNVKPCLYLNSALNTLGISAINLAGTGDCGVTGLLPLANGGTNGATAAAALSNLLGNPAAGNYAINCASTTSCTPTAATISGIDEYWNSAGCAFSADTNGQSCTLAMTIPNGGFADSTYTVQCAPYAASGTGSFGYAMVKDGTKTATGFSLLLVEDWGNSAGAGNSWPEVDCHAHHN